MEDGREELSWFVRNANVSSQGKKVLDGRCEMPGEAELIPGQTCPIEAAPGEAPRHRDEGNMTMAPAPEPLLFRDIRRGDQSHARRWGRSRQAATPPTGLYSLVLARDEQCREQSAEAHNHRRYRPPLVSQPRQNPVFGIRWRSAARGPRYPAT